MAKAAASDSARKDDDPEWFANLRVEDTPAVRKIVAVCADAALLRRMAAALLPQNRRGRPSGPGKAPARQRWATLMLERPRADRDDLKRIVIEEIQVGAAWSIEAGYLGRSPENARRQVAGRSVTIGELRRASKAMPGGDAAPGHQPIDLWQAAHLEPRAADLPSVALRQADVAMGREMVGLAKREWAKRWDVVTRFMEDVTRLKEADPEEAVQELGDLALQWEAHQAVQKRGN